MSSPAETTTAAPEAGEAPTGGSRRAQRDRERRLALRYRDDGDLAAREELITALLPLARRVASRYRSSGERQEDLEQVASVGLVKAVDRYDPERGPLASYAVPSILGELRRHFRDRGWGVHVPRSVQENVMTVNQAIERQSGRLGHAPSVRELADATGMALENVVEALDAGRSYSPAALDGPHPGGDEDERALGDTLGTTDVHYEYVELGAAISPLFQQLPERERVVIHLRFFEDLTQSEIAERIGVSQMQVSRLLRRSLDRLRDGVEDDVEQGAAASLREPANA